MLLLSPSINLFFMFLLFLSSYLKLSSSYYLSLFHSIGYEIELEPIEYLFLLAIEFERLFSYVQVLFILLLYNKDRTG